MTKNERIAKGLKAKGWTEKGGDWTDGRITTDLHTAAHIQKSRDAGKGMPSDMLPSFTGPEPGAAAARAMWETDRDDEPSDMQPSIAPEDVSYENPPIDCGTFKAQPPAVPYYGPGPDELSDDEPAPLSDVPESEEP